MTERQAKYGLDADTLLAANPRLVHATLTGYGLGWPGRQAPRLRPHRLLRPRRRPPGHGRAGQSRAATAPAAQGDHTAALALLASILAALRMVDLTGEGQRLDVSLLSAAAWTMSTDLAATLVDGQNPPQGGRRQRPHALHGGFRCSDGRWVLLFMPEPHWWPRFCDAVRPAGMGRGPAVRHLRGRAPENMAELTVLLDEVFATRTLAEWGTLFDEQGFIWGPGSTVAEFASDAQAEADHLLIRRSTTRTPAVPDRGEPGADRRRRHRPPRAGAGGRRAHDRRARPNSGSRTRSCGRWPGPG